MSISCPLDEESDVEFVAHLKVKDLVSLYRRAGVDVRPIFNEVSELGFYHCPACDLRFFYPPIAGPPSFYEELQQRRWYFEKEREEFSWANERVGNSSSILEIGAGDGNFARTLGASNYRGLEFTRRAIELANKNGIEIIEQSIEEHSVHNHERYDVVCAFQVLEHVPLVRSFINASLRCLKPGGHLLFAVPSIDSFLPSCVNLYENMPPHHVTWWSDRSLVSIGRVFGLIVEDIYHEKLARRHRRWYLATVIAASLRGFDGVLKPRTSLSIFHFLGQVIVGVIAIPFSRLLNDPVVLAKGHSVMVAYRKPAM
jgi:2-polyprenyl-3-methyl-5-hydroxy-6-metoxy-1,4-benzoquinol methylase